jgi:transcriptional regulator with XRE-family HTH domain
MARPLSEKLAELPAARRRKVEARAEELIGEEMSLRQLRKAMGKTQAKVAADLGVGQDSVARYEQRTDMLLSTLSEYVHKIGGTLELTVRFPNRTPIRIKGFGVLPRTPKSARKPTEKGKSHRTTSSLSEEIRPRPDARRIRGILNSPHPLALSVEQMDEGIAKDILGKNKASASRRAAHKR